MRRLLLLLVCCAWSATALGHQGYSFGGSEGHAPLGVMGDHVHRTGEWMLSYRYMRMHMDGNRDGTDRVAESEVVDPAGYGFTVAPVHVDMDTDMHMFGAMYAFSDRFTFMAMLPYLEKSMDHVTRGGCASPPNPRVSATCA